MLCLLRSEFRTGSQTLRTPVLLDSKPLVGLRAGGLGFPRLHLIVIPGCSQGPEDLNSGNLPFPIPVWLTLTPVWLCVVSSCGRESNFWIPESGCCHCVQFPVFLADPGYRGLSPKGYGLE